MEAEVLGAIIGGGAAVAAAVIGGIFTVRAVRRPHGGDKPSPPAVSPADTPAAPARRERDNADVDRPDVAGHAADRTDPVERDLRGRAEVEADGDATWSSTIDAIRLAEDPAELLARLTAAQTMLAEGWPTLEQRRAMLAAIGARTSLRNEQCQRLLAELDVALRAKRAPGG
jgi:hypothetical protein